jgi:leucyl/phenylalanyl-tRNA--protein transferase
VGTAARAGNPAAGEIPRPRAVRTERFDVRVDTAFGQVIRCCAEAVPGRNETWINDAIIEVFEIMHRRGLAHSIETWHGGKLVGGVYGLSLGAAFFAESKFSRETDASKVALVHLAARLKAGGYLLLDAQFPNPHLEQFGAINVAEEKFQALLARALEREGDFYGLGRSGAAGGGTSSGGSVGGGGPPGAATPASGASGTSGWSVLQVITHTS